MKKVLQALGLIFILVAISIGGFMAVSYFNAQTYEAEVLNLVPGIVTRLPQENEYSSLGSYKACPKKESNNIELQLSNPITATVKLDCEFSNGVYHVQLILKLENTGWVLTGHKVYSNLSSSAFNQTLNRTRIRSLG